MFLPFDIGVGKGDLDALDSLALHLDERILPRRWSGRLRRALEAEAVTASTRLEGVPVTVADTLRILAGDPPSAVAATDQALVRGYRDAMSYAQRRADDGSLLWNRELVVAVHDRVLAGSYGAGAGRLRDRSAWVTNDATGVTVFEPPPAADVPALLDELCATVEDADADWHPAIAAAWLHVGIAAIHPFSDGNGRTARVLASLTLYRGGYRHPAFTSLEEWWGRNPESYHRAFDCLGPRFDRDADVTDFVAVHLSAQRRQVSALALRQRIEGGLWTTLENILDDLGLPTRIANALYDSFFDRPVTSAYYRDLIDLGAITARNDLAAAAAAGLVRPEGQTRGRRYLPGPRLLERIAEALGGDLEPTQPAITRELARRAASTPESA